MPSITKTLVFKSGAASSKIPRYDLIPHDALKRLAKRFELGLERYKERSWNGRSSQDALLDKEWVIARASHAIDHAFKLLTKLNKGLPLEDDDAAAIAWAGICLCEATQQQINIEHLEELNKKINDDFDNFLEKIEDKKKKSTSSKQKNKRNSKRGQS